MSTKIWKHLFSKTFQGVRNLENHFQTVCKIFFVNPIPGGGQNCPPPPFSNFFNFLKIGKSYSSDVLGLLVIILWPHFPQFSGIYTILTKSYEHFVTSTRIFSNILNFLLMSALSYIHCCNFFISTASCYILFVYFLRRKEVHPGL